MPVDFPKLSVVDPITKSLKKGPADVVGPWGSGKTLLAAQTAAHENRSLLYLCHGRIEAEGAYEDFQTFAGDDNAFHFPPWEVLPTDIMDPADDIVAERMHALSTIAARPGQPFVVATSLRAILQHVPAPKRLLDDTIVLRAGEEHDLEDLVAKLVSEGYERELMVERRGEISVRGGIFDIFPISAELPYRLEFFGDEIESIRQFEPETQRSVRQVDAIEILPRPEKSLVLEHAQKHGALCTLLDYLPKNTLVVLDEPLNIQEENDRLSDQWRESPYLTSWDVLSEKLAAYPQLAIAQIAYTAMDGVTRHRAPIHSISGWGKDPEGLWSQLIRWDREGYAVALVCGTEGARHRLLELLEEHGYRVGQGAFDLRVEVGHVTTGFVSETDKFALLTEREMFGRKHVRRTRRRFVAGEALTAFNDLKVGDYIVHGHHGVGRYMGLKRFEGKTGDFLTIAYTGRDKLYVPVTAIDQVQKYVGGDGKVPKVDRLGGATWAKTKSKVKKAVRDMTEELVKLYAQRQHGDGHAYMGDTPFQTEFEDAFEYEETPDQYQAILDVKRDMEDIRPMDRLLCGDVGFGKTEVAIRAAFKCVQEGMQTAVLVPTTVLAQQHYSTFSERMADYPVRIEMLSRFTSTKNQKRIVEELKSGEVDIVIGTHRLTSKDVGFKNLGLLILDEEQRFGVKHKEALKKLRASVDVLTLSATPIPRTLNLSLLGVRDMSAINTAPNDRLPVHTCIEAFDERLIQEAIHRELAREGQVFFLHNRVQTIEPVARFVQKLVPRARVAVAHGQMRAHDLEDVMAAFIRKEVDVLVCTTIIGSGLDIPNANTIIIDRADQFGLAELYQLRGRVGRYKHRAFAYLLVPGDKALTEDAMKRLKTLEEFSSLGSGFRVAMRDLEIRGCGNILGGEQHGHINAVGLETYTQLIQEAVAELKGQPIRRRTLPAFEVAVDAYIPDAYVPSEAQKITLYKRITSCQTVEDVDEMARELQDRFGRPPEPVQRLLKVMRLRAVAAGHGVKKISGGKEGVSVEFEHAGLINDKVKNALTHALGGRVNFAWQDRPAVTYSPPENGDIPHLESAARLVQALSEL